MLAHLKMSLNSEQNYSQNKVKILVIQQIFLQKCHRDWWKSDGITKICANFVENQGGLIYARTPYLRKQSGYLSRGIKEITFKQELSKPQIFWQTQLKLFETKLGVCFPPPVIRTNNGCDGTRCYSYYFSQRIQQVQEEPTTAQNTAWISFKSATTPVQIFQC